MHSCIYEGRVAHRRYTPVAHQFRYRLYMAYLDLEELRTSTDVRAFVSQRRFSLGSLLRSDHVAGRQGDLDTAIRELVEERTGTRPSGPIRMLTQLRCLGYYFSPLNLFYCFDPGGSRVEVVVAEVNNTPWREQHLYVLWNGNGSTTTGRLCFEHAKNFHVSPFMDMNLNYRWSLSEPADRLVVRLENHSADTLFFRATLSLSRVPLARGRLLRMSVRYPLMTWRIMSAIHWQALKLWWKKCPVYLHPKKRTPSIDPSN